MAKAKVDDTNVVPETLTAPWVKRFFKQKFGIPVRVQHAKSSGYVNVWIPSDRSVDHRKPIVYHHAFPELLGNLCMRIVYPSSDTLCEQSWGGNITAHSLAMSGDQFRTMFQQIIDLEAASTKDPSDPKLDWSW